MTVKTFGFSAGHVPIMSYHFGHTGPQLLVLGGVHGDEYEGVAAAWGLVHHYTQNFDYKFQLTIVPEFNPDGVLHKQRGNGNGIDLNRNLPTQDWTAEWTNPRYKPGPSAASEPENQHLIKWLEENKPQFILSLHSWHPVINVNGDCEAFAKRLQSFVNYKIDSDIGYPTPGCLGSYTGLERNMPTVTMEIERGLSTQEIMRVHVPAIIESLKVFER